ncbi:MAG: hypothetical protein U0586_14320 [Candidatus Brocadiaceae bacterium]
MIPEHLKYLPTHEWFLFETKSITVGLTHHILGELNKLLFLDLPKVGEEILSGISFGEVESLAMLLDITSPLDGEVIAVNERLFEDLDLLSNNPYEQGWLIKFVTRDTISFDYFLSHREYAAHIGKLQSPHPQRELKQHSKILKEKRKK